MISAVGSLPDSWIEVPEAPDLLLDELTRRGLGDGLPVVPPTAERMAAFLDGRDDADIVLGHLPPREGELTPARVAANAIMAGCRPEWLPVVICGLQAMLDPMFNLAGVQTTTHPAAPLLIVHGPAASRLGFHAGAGLFGPGFRANAAVGRAIRLCLLHIGGGDPGGADRATHGGPNKFSFCIAEDPSVGPWEPYHAAAAGLQAEDSAVTVFAADSPQNVNDHVGTTPERVLGTIATAITHLGANPAYFTQGHIFVVLSPEHANTIAAGGYSRRDAQRFLFDHARQHREDLERVGAWGMQTWPAWMTEPGAPDRLPPAESEDGFRILVAGGPGKHSLLLQGFGSPSVTRRLDL